MFDVFLWQHCGFQESNSGQLVGLRQFAEHSTAQNRFYNLLYCNLCCCLHRGDEENIQQSHYKLGLYHF